MAVSSKVVTIWAAEVRILTYQAAFTNREKYNQQCPVQAS